MICTCTSERKTEKILAQSCDRSRGWRCGLSIFPIVHLYICGLVYLYLNMLQIVPLYAFELVSMCLCMFICLGLTVPDGSLSILIAQLFKLVKYVLLFYCADVHTWGCPSGRICNTNPLPSWDRCNTQLKTGVTLNTHLETGVTINAPIEIEQPGWLQSGLVFQTAGM